MPLRFMVFICIQSLHKFCYRCAETVLQSLQQLKNSSSGIKFCMKLDKFVTEILEMLHHTMGEYSSKGVQLFEYHAIRVSRSVEYQLKSVESD